MFQKQRQQILQNSNGLPKRNKIKQPIDKYVVYSKAILSAPSYFITEKAVVTGFLATTLILYTEDFINDSLALNEATGYIKNFEKIKIQHNQYHRFSLIQPKKEVEFLKIKQVKTGPIYTIKR